MLKELIKLLQSLNYPVTYGSWIKGQVPSLPYLVVLEQARDDMFADEIQYYKKHSYDIELYFNNKNTNLEESIEQLLTDNQIPFSISEDIYIETEYMFEKIYSIEIGEKN